MVSARHIAILASMLVAGVVVGWWATQAPQPDAPHAAAPRPATNVARASAPSEPVEPVALVIEGKQPLDLASSVLGSSKKSAGPDEPGRNPEELKLALPDMATDAVDRVVWAADVISWRSPGHVFDLTPDPVPVPEVESITLFNPKYGLNGFLKQRWVSQRFGFQAGLGLNDERRIQTEEGFRDDIAVGMGIILTF